MSLWTFRPDDWLSRTVSGEECGVLISNCFALSPIRRLSLAKNGELVVTGNTATTNLLLLSLMIICSPNCFLFQVTCSIPLLTAEQLEGIKLTTKRLSREKFDPWSFMNVLTSIAEFSAFSSQNINISYNSQRFSFPKMLYRLKTSIHQNINKSELNSAVSWMTPR